MQIKSILKTNTEDIQWDSIKNQIEIINTAWTIFAIDLSTANVSNDDIVEFGNTLNKCILSIKDENKKETLTNLSTLYSYLPKFLNVISAKASDKNIETTKYNVLVAYSGASQDDWNTVNKSLNDAEKNFLNVVNDSEYSKNREFKINKTHMNIRELKDAVLNEDKQLFLIKYKNLMQSLNTL